MIRRREGARSSPLPAGPTAASIGPVCLIVLSVTPRRFRIRRLSWPVTRPARTSRTDEAATERFLDAQIGGVGAESEAMPAAGGTSVDAYRQRPQRRVTNEAATELFLDHEIERRRYVPPVRTEPVV